MPASASNRALPLCSSALTSAVPSQTITRLACEALATGDGIYGGQSHATVSVQSRRSVASSCPGATPGRPNQRSRAAGSVTLSLSSSASVSLHQGDHGNPSPARALARLSQPGSAPTQAGLTHLRAQAGDQVRQRQGLGPADLDQARRRIRTRHARHHVRQVAHGHGCTRACKTGRGSSRAGRRARARNSWLRAAGAEHHAGTQHAAVQPPLSSAPADARRRRAWCWRSAWRCARCPGPRSAPPPHARRRAGIEQRDGGVGMHACRRPALSRSTPTALIAASMPARCGSQASAVSALENPAGRRAAAAHGLMARLLQAVDDMAANEPRAAADQDTHDDLTFL